MNRKLMVVVLAIGCIPGVLATSAWGTAISIDSVAASPSSNDLTAAGNLDWALPAHSEKAGGTVIASVDGVDGHLSSPFQQVPNNGPNFSYTDGVPGSTSGASNTVAGTFEYCVDGVGSYSAVFDLPVGSGTITAWFGTWSFDGLSVPGTITATFGDLTSATSNTAGDGSNLKAVLSYSTAIAQTLTVVIADSGRSGLAGFEAVAVSTIPEPGTIVLLGTGLLGLLAYAWRKRK